MRLLLILLIVPTICFPQLLTEIKTKSQAENFIKKNFKYYDYKYDLFVIDSVDANFDNFKEGDFNHDGIKDLLIFGKALVTIKTKPHEEDEIVIIIGDKKRPRKVNFPYGFFRSLGVHIIPYPKVISLKNEDFVLIKYDITSHRPVRTFYDTLIRETFYDTLFIQNDHVIPFNKKPSEEMITRVEFKTSQCYGACPVFEMTIDESLDVLYNGIEYVEKKGEYKLKADREDWNYLVELIKNLRVENLKGNYSVEWTDDQTAFLTVVFKNGDKKRIEDYGLSGTFGLGVLYDYFFELRKF